MSAVRLLYSQTYWGQPQKCTGLDQLLLARGPWENEAILIRGIALTHRIYPPLTMHSPWRGPLQASPR